MCSVNSSFYVTNTNANIKSVSVIGLGKLGLSFTVALADAGFEVFGVDKDQTVLKSVENANIPYPEPLVEEYLEKYESRIHPLDSIDKAVSSSDMSFIFVNTPLNEGDHSLEYVEQVTKSIGQALEGRDEFHTVVVRSTVTPGTTTGKIRSWLENVSGQTVGEEIGLCYHPEFSAIGEITESLQSPDFFLVGEFDEASGQHLSELCRRLRKNNASVIRTDPTTAEVAKMANNTFRTLKISFANTIGEIAHEMEADVDDIMESFTEDSNIKSKYLQPGARYGGPCYSRDNIVFQEFATGVGASGELALAADEVNNYHSDWIVDYVRSQSPNQENIGILGLTYKPDSYLMRESQSAHLITSLSDEYGLHCTNPWEVVDIDQMDDYSFEIHSSVETVLDKCQTVVLTTPWEEYTDPAIYAGHEVTLIDPWRVFSTEEIPSSVVYRPIAGKQSKDTRRRISPNE